MMMSMISVACFSCSSFSTSTTIYVDSANVNGLQYDKTNQFEVKEWD